VNLAVVKYEEYRPAHVLGQHLAEFKELLFPDSFVGQVKRMPGRKSEIRQDRADPDERQAHPNCRKISSRTDNAGRMHSRSRLAAPPGFPALRSLRTAQ
jgi:hypothetical protein